MLLKIPRDEICVTIITRMKSLHFTFICSGYEKRLSERVGEWDANTHMCMYIIHIHTHKHAHILHGKESDIVCKWKGRKEKKVEFFSGIFRQSDFFVTRRKCLLLLLLLLLRSITLYPSKAFFPVRLFNWLCPEEQKIWAWKKWVRTAVSARTRRKSLFLKWGSLPWEKDRERERHSRNVIKNCAERKNNRGGKKAERKERKYHSTLRTSSSSRWTIFFDFLPLFLFLSLWRLLRTQPGFLYIWSIALNRLFRRERFFTLSSSSDLGPSSKWLQRRLCGGRK